MSDKQDLSSHSYILNMINEYQHELYRYCRMLTRSDWDADDLLQETLMKLFAFGKKVHIPLQKAYVFRIATNAWIDICRKNKLVFEVLQDEPDIPAMETDPIEIRDSLEMLLHRIPLSQATVMLLIDIFQFTTKETAEMINSSEGAVKAMLHRARTGIRKHFHPHSVEKSSRMSQSKKPNKAMSKKEPPHLVINRFLEAFLRSDPYDISRAYMELNRNEIEVSQEENKGALYFQFRDPEGNLCFIESEIIF
ncbi:RNA polymerase sigma factor [Paenibacillus tarimensis]